MPMAQVHLGLEGFGLPSNGLITVALPLPAWTVRWVCLTLEQSADVMAWPVLRGAACLAPASQPPAVLLPLCPLPLHTPTSCDAQHM